jgi:hypothetical protein
MLILRPEDLLDVIGVDRERPILAVGFGEAVLPKAQSRVSVAMPFVTLQHISPAMFEKAQIDMIVTPLFGQHCDAELVAQELTRLGYSGILKVMCPPLPNQRMVEREIRSEAKGYEVQFLGPSVVLL